MADQGAGGGLESHMTHARKQSDTEQIATEKSTEQAEKSSEDGKFAQPNQQEARQLLMDLSENRASTPGTPSEEVRLTRHSSSSSRRQTPAPRPASLPLEPPVTKSTLSELDVTKIIHNPKLRHDINFDPELHFRPNLDGEKGRKKQEKANQFWNALLKQLAKFVTDRDGFHAAYGVGDDWCLPLLLKAVKEIIQTLVPQRDRDLLNEGLNVELLMQQFNRGIADLEKLASWLSGVLKLHCAPMRDEWVDEMYSELSNGNRNNDMGELVKGMRTLLSVLEAMKLDVANHQIRCLRPVLIEDTVNFEQRFFLKKIQSRRMDIDKAKNWYNETSLRDDLEFLTEFGETTVFFNGLSRLILPSTPADGVPNTFVFDEDRMIKLRSDMYDSICLEICMRRYEVLEQLSRLGHEEPGEFNFNAPLTTSRPSSLVLSDRGSDTSSPRNSGLFASSVPEFVRARPQAQTLYSSLVALLQTAPPASTPHERWRGLAQSMAVQILRYVDLPPNTCSALDFEEELAKSVTNVHCGIFREVEACFHERLLLELAKRAKEFKNLSGVGLFSIATGGRVNGPGRTYPANSREHPTRPGSSSKDPREEAGLEDMGTRLAHLGILHWRVWAQIAYIGDSNNEFGVPLPNSPTPLPPNAI
ncbi:Tcp11-domain-containing protein [Thozetella sp. PMI_491]|nr:Tcp11-domain-containing protein [Thozetella sp. PMI_491]